MHVWKSIKTNYNQTILYLIPAFGLWIIFLLWISFNEANNNKNQKMKNVVSNHGQFENSTSNTIINSITHWNGNATSQIKVMTWNLQGLMRDQLHERTKAAAKVVQSEAPDVIFFQELTTQTHQELSELLQESYSNLIGTENTYSSYFTGIFYRKSIFILENQLVTTFSNTAMDRTQLVVKLVLQDRKNIRLALLTTHLESLPEFRRNRIEQLKECFETCINFPDEYNVVFGGDLNLEEDEEKGTIPENVKDLWVEGGSRESTKYTWDSTQNHNDKFTDANQQPRVRYDRMYFRSSSPVTLKFEKFELRGKELVKGLSYYPSDHWALMSSFSVPNT